MADDGLAATAGATEPATTEAPVYFNSDGTLKEGWQGTLPEGYREEKSLSTVNDTKILAKMFVDTKRMVGKDKIAIPTETSTEGEWAEYHKAGGRPDTKEDYNLKLPEGMAEEVSTLIFPEGRLAKWQERFFKGGTSKKAAEQYIADFTQDILADLQAKQQLEKQEMDELVRGLSTDWGAAYEQKKHLGNMAVNEGCSVMENGVNVVNQDFKARLVNKFGNDPDFIRYSSNLGAKFAEHKSPNFANVPTPSDLQTQIDKLEADPLYLNGTREQRMKLAEQILALRTKIKLAQTTPRGP